MSDWRITNADLKRYPHFDAVLSAPEAESYATNPDKVEKHAFFPFLRFEKAWTKFEEKGKLGKRKVRPLRYAARKDSYIYSHYRFILSEQYEKELIKRNLHQSVLAYRRIPHASAHGGKCNIDFAFEAFETIRSFDECSVLALDISSYFESLDHQQLKKLWCKLLNVERLPKDHFNVYSNITSYAEVDKKSAYERLGFFGEKTISKRGEPIKGYLKHYKEIPKYLCDRKTFRTLIAGGNGAPSLIKRNNKHYGIPQGAPISDLLANLYLIDFDTEVTKLVQELNGKYYRYSDDILIVVPGSAELGRAIMGKVTALISAYGSKLVIKPEKSSLFSFVRKGTYLAFKLEDGSQGKNGLEYLGFRFNGAKAFIRDSTISNLNRKIVRSACREAYAFVDRYPNKNTSALIKLFNYEDFFKKFGKVEDFKSKSDKYNNWTFYTYASRASKAFGPMGTRILKQLRNYKHFARHKIEQELERAVAKRDE